MKKTNKKNIKITKKKIVKNKPPKDTFVSHFHNNGKIALTICSKQIPNTDIYSLGMSLVHAGDQGTRECGKNSARIRSADGILNFNNNQKECFEYKPATGFTALFLKLLGTKQEKPQNILDEVTAGGIYGQSGCWLIKGAKESQKLIKKLRLDEILMSPSNLNRLYHQVFFRLPTVKF